jgi:hypothetical protein
MTTPDALEREVTLRTAVARFDHLRSRDEAPGRHEALELLALGEVIARKAAYGRQLDVRAARAAGASWSQIGAALGTSKQAAWEAHTRWIDEQADQHGRTGFVGLDEAEAAAARATAGELDR